MKKRFVLFWSIISLMNPASAQNPPDSLKVYSLEEARNVHPDSVLALSLKKMKLENLAPEILKYKNLIYLDLSRNKIAVFPPEICSFTKLQHLILNRNKLSKLDECISSLTQLQTVDLWDNPIVAFPEAFTGLRNLRTIHAEGIRFGPTFQENWIAKLPFVRIYFDPPCDCKE